MPSQTLSTDEIREVLRQHVKDDPSTQVFCSVLLAFSERIDVFAAGLADHDTKIEALVTALRAVAANLKKEKPTATPHDEEGSAVEGESPTPFVGRQVVTQGAVDPRSAPPPTGSPDATTAPPVPQAPPTPPAGRVVKVVKNGP